MIWMISKRFSCAWMAGTRNSGVDRKADLVDDDDFDVFLFKFGDYLIRCFPCVARGFAVGNGVHEIGFAAGDFDVWIGVVFYPFGGGKVIVPVGGQLSDALGEGMGCKDV